MKIAYDLLFKGGYCGTSWATMTRDADGTVVIDCLQRMKRVEAIGMPAFRKRSSYRFTATGALLGGRMEDSFGGIREFTLDGSVFRVKGREARLPDRVDLVIESNMVPLTALQLRAFHGDIGGDYNALLPETGAVVPYSLERTDFGAVSTMGETLEIAGDGLLTGITYKIGEFRVERCLRPQPRWSADWTGARRTYRPPGDLRIEDHLLTVAGKEIEATSARPTAPAASDAVAVFVGGTGAYSRHGFAGVIDLGYHQLLDDLAQNRIASIRYEKFDRRAATLDDAEERLDFRTLVNDAGRWLDWLQECDWAAGLPKVVIGHSLGGLVALDLATRRDDLAAVVLLNAPGRSLREVTESQHRWLASNLGLSSASEDDMSALRQALLAALESDQPWDESIDGRLQPLRRKRLLYKSILDIDPAALVRWGHCPIVIVQGGKDVQVAAADAVRLAQAATAANRAATLIQPPELDHLLKRATKEGLDAMMAYADRRRKIPQGLIRRIAKAVSQTITPSR